MNGVLYSLPRPNSRVVLLGLEIGLLREVRGGFRVPFHGQVVENQRVYVTCDEVSLLKLQQDMMAGGKKEGVGWQVQTAWTRYSNSAL